LSKENSTDVVAALQKIAEMPRAEYETAVPEIGTILAMVSIEKTSRENRTTQKTSERLVRWQCPSCKAVQSGFPSTNDQLDRRCYKKFWNEQQRRALECGAQMEVTFDENAETVDELVHWQEPKFLQETGTRNKSWLSERGTR